MRFFKAGSGFTLIEILIIVVIIGILASLALPTLVNQIVSSQATETVTVLGKMMRSVDQCYQVREVVTECDTMNEVLDFTFSTNFSYLFSAAGQVVTVRAYRMGNGAQANDVLTFSIDMVSGIITKTIATAGVYRGLKLR